MMIIYFKTILNYFKDILVKLFLHLKGKKNIFKKHICQAPPLKIDSAAIAGVSCHPTSPATTHRRSQIEVRSGLWAAFRLSSNPSPLIPVFPPGFEMRITRLLWNKATATATAKAKAAGPSWTIDQAMAGRNGLNSMQVNTASLPPFTHG